MQNNAKNNKNKSIQEKRRKVCETAVLKHYKSIYNFLIYLTANTHLAEDLTQEVFIRACEKITNLKKRDKIVTWLHKIAYNKFIDIKRKDKTHITVVDKIKQQNSLLQSHDPLSQIIDDEHSQILYSAMKKLQQSHYLVVVLHYIQQLSFRQIAKVLDEPVGTIKWRTNQALKNLKQLLSGRIE